LYDDAKRLAEKAQCAGIEADLYEWSGMIHDFQLAARILKEGRESISLVGDFLRRHMST
jgi:acetyl esterase/lipase